MTKMSLQELKELFVPVVQKPFKNKSVRNYTHIVKPSLRNPCKKKRRKTYAKSVWKWFKPQRQGSRKVGRK